MRIADNKLALNAGWDEELLALEIGELQEPGLRPRPDRLFGSTRLQRWRARARTG